ncbi:5' nucleotidase A [Haematobia irritans]|uniref:5' nucleotidase A n=1 Tax=Haematobia irritans TaxID=7368 RepID=UPI003F500AF2
MHNLSARWVPFSKFKLDTETLFTFANVLCKNITIRTAASESSTRSIQRSMSNFKDFRISDYDIIGFDLDGTLLRYNLNNMVPLEYNILIKYLMEKGYPRAMLDKKFDSDFIQKGLIVDADRGNLLKLAYNGEILRAAHGTRFLSSEEIEEVYGMSRKWHIAQDYIKDPLSAWNGPVSEKLRTLLDYFDIAASIVFAQAVDVLDEQMGKINVLQKDDYRVWPDILAGLIKMYTRDHFNSGESEYFEALKQNPAKYILKTDQKLVKYLRDLRSSGKSLYLLTGSNIDFANFTASYALGPDWMDLFNCVISFAKKPGFFSMQRQFLQNRKLAEVPNSELPLENDILAGGTNFSQGNWHQLKHSLCKHILHKEANETRCLYVGDNLIQDIYGPKTTASLEGLAICEEMLEDNKDYEYKNIIQSESWGSYFHVNGKSTLWSSIIERYSNICISHMDVIAQIPVNDEIRCKNKQGYFPKVPNGVLVKESM